MFSLTENQKKLILAFVIAVLLWGYASNQTANIFNYGEEQAASFLVDIEVRNLAEDYQIESMSVERAVVRIDYVSYFSQLSRDDITAYVDLRNVDPGDNMKIIEVELPGSARLIGVDPGYLLVNIARKDE
jgi:YbbR domain-containing protein